MESATCILQMKRTCGWGNQGKSTEGRGAGRSRLRRGEHFRSGEDSERVAKLEMGSQVDKHKLCSRVTCSIQCLGGA